MNEFYDLALSTLAEITDHLNELNDTLEKVKDQYREAMGDPNKIVQEGKINQINDSGWDKVARQTDGVVKAALSNLTSYLDQNIEAIRAEFSRFIMQIVARRDNPVAISDEMNLVPEKTELHRVLIDWNVLSWDPSVSPVSVGEALEPYNLSKTMIALSNPSDYSLETLIAVWEDGTLGTEQENVMNAVHNLVTKYNMRPVISFLDQTDVTPSYNACTWVSDCLRNWVRDFNGLYIIFKAAKANYEIGVRAVDEFTNSLDYEI